MKSMIYVVMVLTGILVISVGLKTDPLYEKVVGTMMIFFGAINLLLTLMRKKAK
jgi:hypothetical protein